MGELGNEICKDTHAHKHCCAYNGPICGVNSHNRDHIISELLSVVMVLTWDIDSQTPLYRFSLLLAAVAAVHGKESGKRE